MSIDQDTECVRVLSSVVFGQRYRLELMHYIGSKSDGIFCLKEASEGLGIVGSNLQRPLHDLLKAELIAPLPQLDSKRRYYHRLPSQAWTLAEELMTRCES